MRKANAPAHSRIDTPSPSCYLIYNVSNYIYETYTVKKAGESIKMKKAIAMLLSVVCLAGVLLGGRLPAQAAGKPAKPGNVRAAAASATSIQVRWGKVAGASGYEIYRATSKDGKYTKAATISKSATTSYTDKKRAVGKTYFYKVRAYKAAKGKKVFGAYGAIASAKAAPPKPGNAQAAATSATSIQVRWGKAAGASGYEIYRATSKGGKYTKAATISKSATTSYTDKKRTKGKTYFYKVRAYTTVKGKKVFGPYSAIASAKAQKTQLAAPSVSGALAVKGAQLVDRKGKPIQLRGISTHGIAWFPEYINEACFRQLRQEWNVNAVRLALYTEEYGGYCAGGDKKRLKELIHKGVTCAVKQDMYVIIDWHILSDGDPNRHLKEAQAFFQEMSAKYAGYDNVIYEICNEPNGGVSWKKIKTYAEKIAGVIRKNDRDAVILVGTPNWSQYVEQAAKDPITKYDNIMYTLHFYAATHKDSLRNAMEKAVQGGLPVFVSEYGICDASGSGAIDRAQAEQWVKAMDRLGVSYMAWNLSNKAETSAILKSSCRKTAGFSQSDLSESGKWLYTMLSGKKSAASSAPSPAPDKKPAGSGQSTIQKGKFSCTAQLRNTWESGGETYWQYEVTIRNDGKAMKVCEEISKGM